MRIKSLTINNINGIKHLELQFNDNLNLICGTNGIGKTTILNCVSNTFARKFTIDLKRNAHSDKGNWTTIIRDVSDAVREKILSSPYILETTKQQLTSKDKDIELTLETTCFLPNSNETRIPLGVHLSPDIIVFKNYRDISYIEISALAKDPDRNGNEAANLIEKGVSHDNIKNWLVARYMFLPHDNNLDVTEKANFKTAKNIFSSLDPSVKFSKILANTFEVMVTTPQGEIYLEYLSSGYKSCLYILLGIIKEIEFRNKDSRIFASDYSGIIIIDEIDLHLHPQWQVALINALKTTFPNAQIIAATHSPSMIQAAAPNEVIPLISDANGNVMVKNLEVNEYGFQGWTIEEILKDVMGMESTASSLYTKTINDFDKAMDDEDYEKIIQSYNILKQMLHKNNPLRKMLKIQIAGIEVPEK